MPSPSRSALILSICATAAILVVGAWAASKMTTEYVQTRGEGAQSDASRRDSADETPPAFLSVTVTGIRSASGRVYAIAFDNEQAYEAYDYWNAAGFAVSPAAPGELSFAFDDLAEGPYAVSVFHDENGNDDFDVIEGIPEEGYGTSGDAGPLDYASFDEAAVPPGEVTIRMHYLN